MSAGPSPAPRSSCPATSSGTRVGVVRGSCGTDRAGGKSLSLLGIGAENPPDYPTAVVCHRGEGIPSPPALQGDAMTKRFDYTYSSVGDLAVETTTDPKNGRRSASAV